VFLLMWNLFHVRSGAVVLVVIIRCFAMFFYVFPSFFILVVLSCYVECGVCLSDRAE
jgi:hypothetical protein